MTFLDPELSQALQLAAGAPITVLDPQTQTEYVVLRADVYDRVKSLLDVGDLSPEEKLLLLAESGRCAGWESPEMDDYNDYDAHRK